MILEGSDVLGWDGSARVSGLGGRPEGAGGTHAPTCAGQVVTHHFRDVTHAGPSRRRGLGQRGEGASADESARRHRPNPMHTGGLARLQRLVSPLRAGPVAARQPRLDLQRHPNASIYPCACPAASQPPLPPPDSVGA